MPDDCSLDGILAAIVECRQDGATLETLATLACGRLAGHEPESAARRLATERFGTFEAVARDAYRRYPVVAGSSFHGGRPDLRPAVHFQTVSVLRNAGAYLPDDLDRMSASGELSLQWVNGEAARLVVLLALAGIAACELAADRLGAAAYRVTIASLVRQLGSVAMPHQRHP